MLTNGNDDVNFYCMCIQNQNREAATNSPIKFALNLIKSIYFADFLFKAQTVFGGNRQGVSFENFRPSCNMRACLGNARQLPTDYSTYSAVPLPQ